VIKKMASAISARDEEEAGQLLSARRQETWLRAPQKRRKLPLQVAYSRLRSGILRGRIALA
jgi:hypothetical protein